MDKKYIKYKQKYLDLKNKIVFNGGGIDLDNMILPNQKKSTKQIQQIQQTIPIQQVEKVQKVENVESDQSDQSDNPDQPNQPNQPNQQDQKNINIKKGFYNYGLETIKNYEMELLAKIDGPNTGYLYKSKKCDKYIFESNEDVLNTKSKKIKIKVWTPSLSNELPDLWNNCEIEKPKSQLSCPERIILDFRQEIGSAQIKANDKAISYEYNVKNSKDIPSELKSKAAKELDRLGLEIISSDILKNIDNKIYEIVKGSNSIADNIELANKLKLEYINELSKISKQVEDVYNTVKNYIKK